jgi:UDP:flavonoid glycosyltransferase YjiC (YdhE family)
MRALAERLGARGVQLSFSSFGEGAEFLQAHGLTVHQVTELDVGWTGFGAFAGLRDTAARFPGMLFRFLAQVRQELRLQRRFHPDLVLADSRLSTVLAGRLLSHPTILIANQLRILLPPYVRRPAWLLHELNGEVLGQFWNAADSVLVPDLPPPHTLARANVWGVRAIRDKIRYVGFFTRAQPPDHERRRAALRDVNLSGKRALVYAQVSGPAPTRTRLITLLLAAGRTLSQRYDLVISGGWPQGSRSPRRINGAAYFDWCPWKDEFFAAADVIVLRAGHTSLAQAVVEGRPVVCTPLENHSEQLANAQRVAELGIGRCIPPQALSLDSLIAEIDRVAGDETIKRRAIGLRGVAQEFDGVERSLAYITSTLPT